MADPLKTGVLLRRLQRHREATEFDRNGLGDAILDATTDVIHRDFEDGVSPDGTPWPPLSPAYEEYKRTAYITTQMGYAEMVMAGDPEQFRGSRYISKTEARASFGITQEAIEEAAFFQIDRPFWGLNAESINRSVSVARERFLKAI